MYEAPKEEEKWCAHATPTRGWQPAREGSSRAGEMASASLLSSIRIAAYVWPKAAAAGTMKAACGAAVGRGLAQQRILHIVALL